MTRRHTDWVNVILVQRMRSASMFLPRNARSAKRSIAVISRPSVTLMYAEHIG